MDAESARNPPQDIPCVREDNMHSRRELNYAVSLTSKSLINFSSLARIMKFEFIEKLKLSFSTEEVL